MISAAELVSILPNARKRAALFLAPLNDAMSAFGITTGPRVAAFLAQVGHESGSFLYMRELASGEAYDTGSKAKNLGNTPEADGDGQRYKGRGPIQITGRSNYRACSLALFGDDRLLQFPELLEDPAIGCKAAGWFWKLKGLNELADVGDFRRITKIINGGYTHYEQREALYKTALIVLGTRLPRGSNA